MPIVLIDQHSDSEATIVQLSFGDRLGGSKWISGLLFTCRCFSDLFFLVYHGYETITCQGLTITSIYNCIYQELVSLSPK